MLSAGANVSANALASSQIPDNQIPYSKADLNGYAVQLEDDLLEQAPYLQAGLDLADLINNPQRFQQLTQVYMERMLRVPGGVDIHGQVYLPLIREINARDPRVQAVVQQQSQQRQQQQQAQQQQQQLNNAGFAQLEWEDGGMPLASGRNEATDFGKVISSNASQSWMAVDQLDRQGAFRGVPLVQF